MLGKQYKSIGDESLLDLNQTKRQIEAMTVNL